MTYLDLIILGIIQGITEFLPISSSGHLVLFQYFLNVKANGVLLEVLLHFGTLMAIIYYYFNDIKDLIKNVCIGHKTSINYFIYIIIATIPIAITGYMVRDVIEYIFNPYMTFYMYIITGMILLLTYFKNNNLNSKINLFSAMIIGLSQSFALLPGISRSGITISFGLFCGIKHNEAAKFSFLLSIPALVGAIILQLLELKKMYIVDLLPLIIGMISAAISGYLIISWLIVIIAKGKFYYFSFYCFLLAFIGLFFIL